MRTAKTLIRLGGCPGWSESSLGAHSFCWFCHVAAYFSIHTSAHLFLCCLKTISLTWCNLKRRSNGFKTLTYFFFFFFFQDAIILEHYPITPGNVVRGNQKLCKWNPYGSSRSWLTELQTVNKHVNAPWVFTFCQFSEVDILKSGNVVPNSFHFYARWN